ncbi:MAG: hypothetical protein ACLTXI_01330 [Collinsella sp.]
MGSVCGFVPRLGCRPTTADAPTISEVRCERRPEAQLLGSAIGMRVMADVPYHRAGRGWAMSSMAARRRTRRTWVRRARRTARGPVPRGG